MHNNDKQQYYIHQWYRQYTHTCMPVCIYYWTDAIVTLWVQP